MTRSLSLDYSPLVKGASFLINAYCCLDYVVVVANNSLIRLERFRESGNHDTGVLMPCTFSAALSPVGRSLPLSPPETVSQKTLGEKTVTSVDPCIHSQIVSHIPDVHRSVLNATCTPCHISIQSREYAFTQT